MDFVPVVQRAMSITIWGAWQDSFQPSHLTDDGIQPWEGAIALLKVVGWVSDRASSCLVQYIFLIACSHCITNTYTNLLYPLTYKKAQNADTTKGWAMRQVGNSSIDHRSGSKTDTLYRAGTLHPLSYHGGGCGQGGCAHSCLSTEVSVIR